MDFDDQGAPFFNPDQSKGVVGVARGFNGDPISCPEGFRDAFAATFDDGPRDNAFYIAFN